jgi:hypothetical protein
VADALYGSELVLGLLLLVTREVVAPTRRNGRCLFADRFLLARMIAEPIVDFVGNDSCRVSSAHMYVEKTCLDGPGARS